MAIINGRGRVGIRRPSAAQIFSIVSGNMILHLDAGNSASYPGTGTTWTDLSGSGNNGTLVGSPAYSTAGGGVIGFDGIDDVVNLGSKTAYSPSTASNFTLDLWIKPTGNNWGTAVAFKGTQMNAYEWMVYLSHDGTKNSGPFTVAFYKKGANGSVEAPGAGGNILAIGSWYNYVAVLENGAVKQYVNGNLYMSTTFSNSTIATTTNTLYLGRGWSGTANVQISSARLYSKSLTPAEVVQNFRSAVGRFYQVVSDADAQAFVAAAGLTSSVQANAVNTLVASLKSAGIWTKMKAIYPFVGGSAASHKWNLKDPRDLDAAYRLTFGGTGWVHSSTGAKPGGVSDFANTFFVPNSNLQLNSGHLSTYLRNHTTKVSVDIGSQAAGNSFCTIVTAWSDGKTYYSFNSVDEGIAYTTTNKFHIVSRTASNAIKLYRNNAITVGTTVTNIKNVQNIYIGALNNSGGSNYYSNRETAFASIGDGLTDAEASSLYDAVQAYQTALGRQV